MTADQKKYIMIKTTDTYKLDGIRGEMKIEEMIQTHNDKTWTYTHVSTDNPRVKNRVFENNPKGCHMLHKYLTGYSK